MSSNRKKTTVKSRGVKRSRRARQGNQEIVWVYFKPAEKKAIEKAAEHQGVSMSELVASAILREVGVEKAMTGDEGSKRKSSRKSSSKQSLN